MKSKKLQIKNENLPNGWRKVKLGEIVNIKMGQSPSSQFYNSRGEGLPFYQGITDFGSKYPNKSVYCTNTIKIAEKGEILFSVRAPVGEVNVAIEKSCIGRGIAALSMKNKNNEFLYYLLKYHTQYFKSISGGTTYESIGKDQIAEIELLIPEDINEQKRIADILSAFDDKIELNNKIIKTLEEMAQEVFKEWFIKFNFPVEFEVKNEKLKVKSLGYKDAGGKFVDSELGKIPEGWEVIDLYDYISFEGGSQPPKSMHIYEKRAGYVRFIQNRDYESDAHITYIPESKRNKLCNEYDIMMDKYGEAGKVRFGLAGAYNVALSKIIPKPPLMREYLRWFLKQPEIEQMIEGSAVASTRASVNKIVFKNLKILLPPKDLMEKFEQIGKLYINNYLKLKVENQKLAALRDLLLPKLMSGEILVNSE